MAPLEAPKGCSAGASSWVVRRCGNTCFALGFILTAVLVAVVVGTHAGRALLFKAVPEALIAGETLDALLAETVSTASCGRRPWAHGRPLDGGETRALFLVDAYAVTEAALGPAARRNRGDGDAASAEASTLVVFLFSSLDRVFIPALGGADFRARYRRAARATWTCTRSSNGVAYAAAAPVLDRHYHTLTVVCALPDGIASESHQLNAMAALEAPIGEQRETLSIAARDAEGEVLLYTDVAPCRRGDAAGAFFAARNRVAPWPGGGGSGGGDAAARIPLALCTSVGADDATPRALLPWVIYHRAVGFDTVVVYINAPRADKLIRAMAWSDEGRALVDDGGLVLVPWDFSRGHRAVSFFSFV